MLRNSYDLIAEQWNANFRGQAYVDRTLGYVDRVLDGLPTGAKVLDLGCGTGKPIAEHIADRGFSVVGVDQSSELFKIAKEVVPGAQLIHADMLDVELEEDFAAAVAWDSIFHVDRKHHAVIFQKLANALSVGGRLLLSVGGSDAADAPESDPDHKGFTSEMFGQTFFYSGYAPQTARALIEAAGFEIELWEIDDPASKGHIAIIGRKL